MYQQLILIGNLGNDPELRHTASNVPVASFNLAVSRKWSDSSGETKEKTTWFRVSVWNEQANAVHKYLTKGRQVMVVGEIEEARVFVDKTGTARASLEVKALQVKFLGQKGEAVSIIASSAPVANGTPAPAGQANKQDEDIPF